ncbi:MAG: aldo/keto reductase [Rikenellaceae bacterium]
MENQSALTTPYRAAEGRYDNMKYNLCGASGLALPPISLGLWHNFGTNDNYDVGREMILHSFDRGITHFDLANNYGPLPGSAEITMGRVIKEDLHTHRDELIISSKAGHEMWSGPYGGNCSRKSLLASLDQSLSRTGLDYLDIFYTHRYDGVTPIEETAQALTDAVRSGKALYVGISKYPPEKAQKIYDLLRKAGTPAVVAQYRYNLLERGVELREIPCAAANGASVVAFSPLAQGLLGGRYIDGIPEGSRVAGGSKFLTPDSLTPKKMVAIKALNEAAKLRGESLAQMSLAWTLRNSSVASLVIGASSVAQIDDNLKAIDSEPFSPEELRTIDNITLYL